MNTTVGSFGHPYVFVVHGAIAARHCVDRIHNRPCQAVIGHVSRGACHGGSCDGDQRSILQRRRSGIEVIKRDAKGSLITLNQHQRMQATPEKPPCLSHQFSSHQYATGDAVATRLLLGFSQLNKRFRSGVFDKQLGDNFRTVVGDRCFSVGLVEHFVQALWAKGTLHEITESDCGRNQFLSDTNAACHRGCWSNDGYRSTATSVVGVCHQASPEGPVT